MADKITETIIPEGSFSPEKGETGASFRPVDSSREDGGVKRSVSEEALKAAVSKGEISPEAAATAQASLETDQAGNLSPETVVMLHKLGIEGLTSSDAVTKILDAEKDFDPFSATEAAGEMFDSEENE